MVGEAFVIWLGGLMDCGLELEGAGGYVSLLELPVRAQ